MLKTHRSEVVYVEYFQVCRHFAAEISFPPNPLGLGFGGIWNLTQGDIPGGVSI